MINSTPEGTGRNHDGRNQEEILLDTDPNGQHNEILLDGDPGGNHDEHLPDVDPGGQHNEIAVEF